MISAVSQYYKHNYEKLIIAPPTLDSPSIWDNLETFEEEVKAVKRKDENSQPAQLVYETEKVIEH